MVSSYLKEHFNCKLSPWWFPPNPSTASRWNSSSAIFMAFNGFARINWQTWQGENDQSGIGGWLLGLPHVTVFGDYFKPTITSVQRSRDQRTDALHHSVFSGSHLFTKCVFMAMKASASCKLLSGKQTFQWKILHFWIFGFLHPL